MLATPSHSDEEYFRVFLRPASLRALGLDWLALSIGQADEQVDSTFHDILPSLLPVVPCTNGRREKGTRSHLDSAQVFWHVGVPLEHTPLSNDARLGSQECIKRYFSSQTGLLMDQLS